MAEEEQAVTPPEVPQGMGHKLKEVVLVMPTGMLVVPGDRVEVGEFPNGVMYVDAIQPRDGSIERFVGVPFIMKLASNRLVQPVASPIIAPT